MHAAAEHGLGDRVPGDERAVVGEDRDLRVADHLGEVGAELGAVDLARVVVDEAQVAVEHGPRLVDDLGQLARGREQRHVVRVVVHDDAGVLPSLVQLGMDVDRGGDVPCTLDHVPVEVDGAHVGRPHLVPPEAPRVDPHALAVVAPPRDVPGDVLGESLVGEDPEGARQRLAVVEVDADRRRDARRPAGEPAVGAQYRSVSHGRIVRPGLGCRPGPGRVVPTRGAGTG